VGRVIYVTRCFAEGSSVSFIALSMCLRRLGKSANTPIERDEDGDASIPSTMLHVATELL
jgi:hypothetical protein